MKINLKLSHMGLILLGIPAAFEILFVIAIFVLLHQAEQEIKQESHSREVIAHAHKLSERITNAAISIGAYGYSKSPLAKQTFEAAVNGMHNELRILGDLLRGNNKQLDRLLAINNTADSAIKQIEEARIAIEHASALSLLGGDTMMSDNLDKLSTLVGRLQKQINELVHAEANLNRDLPARRARSRQQVMMALVAGALFNICLAIALAGFFSRAVTRRHLVIMDNTVRLAKAQPLHPPLEGTDEIAQIDSVFHSMVRELDAADQFKKQLIAMVSHELRAPLTSIDAILTFLEAGGMGDLPAGVTKRLGTAESEVQRLIALINDLLDVEKMEAGKFEMSFELSSLASILDRSVASVSGAVENKRISLQVPQTDLLVWADADRLVQVVVNLLSNAVKFSPEGGMISIVVEKLDSTAEIRVKDEGRGIPADFQKKIFERFSQVEVADAKVRGGSGLGLSVCKAIVLQHGGSIGVESEEGKGATFWFRIPLKQP